MGYRGALVLLGVLPLLIAAGSFVAGERMEVVVLRTTDGHGHAHDTKLWIVDHDGHLWLRSVRPTLRWLERIRANPRVELVRRGETRAYTASIVESLDAKRAIDDAIAAKYGLIDRWYELLVRHETIPIRLDPDPETSGG
ncbi:MAG TPA: nitroreductase/quinone reductase family protein [Myxococcota bacterium]|jgi:hypothetical protein